MSQWADSIKALHVKVKSLAMLLDWQRTLLEDVLGGFSHFESRLLEAAATRGRPAARRARKAARTHKARPVGSAKHPPSADDETSDGLVVPRFLVGESGAKAG